MEAVSGKLNRDNGQPLLKQRAFHADTLVLMIGDVAVALAKLHMSAFLFKIAGRDPAFGRWMRVTFALAMIRGVPPYCLVVAGVAVILVAYNAMR